MSRLPRLVCIVAVVLCAGCYHATVETGAAPSNLVIHKSFASGWIFGLVPPSTIETQSRCPHGPAKVETQLSFVNQLVSFLTLSIYTPMEIKVTCAAPGREQGAMGSQGASPTVDRNVPSATTLGPLEEEGKAPPRELSPTANAGIRSNDELLMNAGFRQAMTDVLRMRIVTGFRELQPDTLTVDLGDGHSRPPPGTTISGECTWPTAARKSTAPRVPWNSCRMAGGWVSTPRAACHGKVTGPADQLKHRLWRPHRRIQRKPRGR
jgi:hypothetical protein